ncbi:MAG: class I adenylate-forming enzyme family protein [Pseudomonadota bacterium]
MPLYGPRPDAEKPVDVSNLLRAGLEAHPDEIALVSIKNSWTWRQLDKAADRYAAHLHGLGVRKGDRVASLMPNRDALIVHYLGCIKGGFVAVPLNYRYMAPEIDHALSLTKSKILLAHIERDKDLAASKEVGKLPLGVIRYGAGEGDGSFEAMLIKEPAAVTLPTPDPTDPMVIFFTSGSTGKPKGVTHSYETYGWTLTMYIEGYQVKPDEVVLPASSMSHVGGLNHSLMVLAVGGKSLVARTFDPDELLWLLRHHRPNLLWMLPHALIGLVRDHGATRDDFRSLRLCVSGGDKVPAQLEKEFTELVGFPIDEVYGMSEIGPSNLNPISGLNKLGSIGSANTGYALSIRDEDGNEVGPNVEGRLWVKSKANMIGYWGNPTATAETIVDGWLDTGDVMRADEDGYLWFCGRKKQIIVHDGSNICPQEVEESLIEHPAVSSAGVVGVHDLVHGENVRAFVTLLDDVDPPTAQSLIEHTRVRVGYKAPEVIVFLDEMPLNATGKTDRVTLKRWAAESNDAEVRDL